MIRTFVALSLSAIMMWTSLAQASGGAPLLSRLAIDAAKNYSVTQKGVMLMGPTWLSRQAFSNSALYANGVRNMRLVNHAGAEYLVMLNGQNQVMRAVHFSRTSSAALDKFKPSLFRQTLALSGANKLGHIIKDKAMHFPIEAVAFGIAIGAITFYQIANELPKNPMAMRQFIDGQMDGHSQFSFYLFMVAAGVAAAPFEEALRQKNKKLLGHFVNYYSMSVGMLASHMYNDMLKAQGMRECAWAMLTADVRNVPTICDAAWEEYMKTWRDPDQRAQRWNELSISGINLLASAGLAAVTAWSVEKVLVAVGVNLGMFMLPGGFVARAPRIASWTMRGIKSTVSAFNFMAWTTYLEEATTMLYENALHTGPELNNLSQCLGVHFERLSTPDRNRYQTLNWAMASSCNKTLPEYYDQFLKTSVRWRNENMTPVINSQKNWEMHLTELSTYYRLAERFYQDVTVAIDVKRNIKVDGDGKPTNMSSLDSEMYYFGVTPQTYTDDMTPERVEAARQARINAMRTIERELEERARQEELARKQTPGVSVPPSAQEGEELTLQGDQLMPPLFRTPVTPPAADTQNEQQKPEFSWGHYLTQDFKGFEKDQDNHLKYVTRGMYRMYLKMINEEHAKARPLSEEELKNAKILLERADRRELLRDPMARFRRLPPAPQQIKFSDKEMQAMRELIKKMASNDRKVVGDALIELYQSVSPELSGTNVKLRDRKIYSPIYTAYLDAVYRALGQPMPMKEPGRGYMMAWTLFQDETAKKLNDKPTDSPFSRVNRQTFTPTAAEYLTTAMIWGPDLSKGDELVGTNSWGFKSVFHPPKLIPSGDVYVWNSTNIQENTNDQLETIYTRLIWMDSDKTPGCTANKKTCYKPILQWIREGHLRPDVMSPTQNNIANWWEQKVKPPYLDAWMHFEKRYEHVIKQFLTTLYGEDRYFHYPIPFLNKETGVPYQWNQQHMLNPSEFKNGVLPALNQERQVALFFLSQVLDGQFQARTKSTERPRDITIMKTVAGNPGLSPVVQSYEKLWQTSVALFLNMKIPLALMQSEFQTESKFIPRLQNSTLVEYYEKLNKIVDEFEKKLEVRASFRDDEFGDFKQHPM